jgi:hypothetical protein
MSMYIAQVTANGTRDFNSLGTLTVEILNQEFTKLPVDAKSIMQFGGKGSGIFGTVTPLSKVLVTQVSRVNIDGLEILDWYWIGVIPEMDWVKSGPIEKIKTFISSLKLNSQSTSPNPDLHYGSTIPEASEMYHSTKTPDRTIIKNVIGHKLVLAEKVVRNKNKIISQEDYAQLATNTNKQIKLDAGVGPGKDQILIADEYGNKIVIKSGAEDPDTPGANSINIDCIGNTHITSNTGEVVLTAGTQSTSNISIYNRGAGDIHIMSVSGDVTVKAEQMISVQSLNAEVIVQNDATVTAVNNINLDAGNDLNIKATKEINLTADKINMVKG